MLKKETAEVLGKVLPKGITVEELTQAISSTEEVELTIPEGRFLDKTSEETLLDNHGKSKYDAGKLAGSEMTIKDLKEKAELDIQTKDVDSILTALNDKALKGVNTEPNKKVEELQTSLSTLQQKYEDDIKIKDTLISQKESELHKIGTVSKIQGLLPDLKEGITNDVAITIFNTTHEIKEDGIFKNGQLLKNDLQSPLSLEDAVGSFINERGWKKETPKGHGGKKPTPNGAMPKSYEDFQKYCDSKGWNEGSLEAKEYLKTIRDKNPQFEMN